MEEERPFICGICLEDLCTAAELEEHIEKKHQKELWNLPADQTEMD